MAMEETIFGEEVAARYRQGSEAKEGILSGISQVINMGAMSAMVEPSINDVADKTAQNTEALRDQTQMQAAQNRKQNSGERTRVAREKVDEEIEADNLESDLNAEAEI